MEDQELFLDFTEEAKDILDEIILYFDEKGYTKESATKMFNYYDCSNWIDSKKTASSSMGISTKSPMVLPSIST